MLEHVHTNEGRIGPKEDTTARCIDDEIETHVAMYSTAFFKRFTRTRREDGCGFLYRDLKAQKDISEQDVREMIRSGYTQ